MEEAQRTLTQFRNGLMKQIQETLQPIREDLEDLQTMIANGQQNQILSPQVAFAGDSPPPKRRRALSDKAVATSLEEAQAFFGDTFYPPRLEQPDLKDDTVESIEHEYRTMFGSFTVFRQNDAFKPVWNFVQNVVGILGPYSDKVTLQCPLIFTFEGEMYRWLGCNVMDRQLIAQVLKLANSPQIEKIRNKKDNISDLIQDALSQRNVCWLWSQSAAYGLLMGMDLKSARYVDKQRKTYLVDKHN